MPYIGRADQEQLNISTNLGPAFHAIMSANQGLSANTATKLNFDTEVFDTSSAYDTANKRFLPLVAGYYQVNINIGAVQSQRTVRVFIYKNGALYCEGTMTLLANTTSQYVARSSASNIIYLNGSTDYIEGYGLVYVAGDVISSSDKTYFSAALVRTA